MTTGSWLPPAEAAAALKIAPSSLRSRFTKGKARRDERGWYWVEHPAFHEPETSPAQGTPAIAVKHDDGVGAAYYFDESRDKYLFSLRSKAQAGKPFVLSGDTVRAILQAYSRDGSAATINEICRTFGLNRTTAREILQALGKTHDSAPFTDEAIAAGDEAELAEDLVRLKEERIIRTAERASWEQTKKLAEEARHFDRFIARRIEEIIAGAGFAPPAPAPAIRTASKVAQVSAVFGLTDAHVGARAWAAETGHDTTIESVRARTMETTRRLIERVLRFCRPARWLLPSGSDNIHADTDLGTTTRGTPLDTDGSLARMFLAACGIYEELIGMLLAVAPVEVIAVPGNHDMVMSMMLTHWLAARFRTDERVKVGSCVEHRSYHLHGRALMGFSHGDGIPDARLPLVMASEASEQWGQSRHRMIFTGHLHTDRAEEYAGCRVIHMPTLATADRWHHRKGFTGNTRAIAAYLVDHEEGLVASLPVQPGSTA